MEQQTATVAANIRAEMARRQVSQMTLAEGIDLSQSGVSKRLKGHVPWTLPELARVAAFLGLPLTDLIEGRTEAASA